MNFPINTTFEKKTTNANVLKELICNEHEESQILEKASEIKFDHRRKSSFNWKYDHISIFLILASKQSVLG